jgi:hypothetical protein
MLDISFFIFLITVRHATLQAKALAEKNERDMQVQREQAERDVSVMLSIYLTA